MPANWDRFVQLPGSTSTNFELLCRSLIRRHYEKFGHFRGLVNQPGVEFHLELHTSCELGEPGRWYGWQCRWYDLPMGAALGSNRRAKIQEAINKTKAALPKLTDWVLWTRHALTKADQKWFYSLEPGFNLALKTAVDVEDLLTGPAAILQSTYFGDLVLLPEDLANRHEASAAQVRGRWLPEVHQVLDAERAIGRALISPESWSHLTTIAERIREDSAHLSDGSLAELLVASEEARTTLCRLNDLIKAGDHEALSEVLSTRTPLSTRLQATLRRLRAQRSSIAPTATNLMAELTRAQDAMAGLERALHVRFVAVMGDAGQGKTELAAQTTAPPPSPRARPAGVLLHGRDLSRGTGLDELARTFVLRGAPVQTFEALVAGVDAAGRRAGRRIPIFIDGLNEAEDPRDWKTELASLIVSLRDSQYVLVVCTLRSDFRDDALPDDIRPLELNGFARDRTSALRRYFQHYKIDATDALLPMQLLDHPLTLRMFCEVTNGDRQKTVGIEAMPSSLTGLFHAYLKRISARIADLSPSSGRYYEADVANALNRIGTTLWEQNRRSLELANLRQVLRDEARPWNVSLVRALESEGILIRVRVHESGTGELAFVYDALAGHIIADALMDEHGGSDFADWYSDCETRGLFGGNSDSRHTLSTDVFYGLVYLSPRRRHRQQFWKILSGAPQRAALVETAWLEAEYLDSETITRLQDLVGLANTERRDLLARLQATRAARSHPLDAQFLDSALRAMSIPQRDLYWTEWLRKNDSAVIADILEMELRWEDSWSDDKAEKLRARWLMWTLTSTVRRLRDYATRALHKFGCRAPKYLFELTLESLSINDPYVAERMLAACYGVAMSTWCDPSASELKGELPQIAKALVAQMFLPEAPHATHHALMVDSALGVIDIAKRLAPDCIERSHEQYLTQPFNQIPSGMDEPLDIDPDTESPAESAIHMDFGNYTIGHLVPNRRNYDDSNLEYKQVLGAIQRRILELGYSPEIAALDRNRRDDSWGYQPNGKVDRYGKKYSWIAYFEMFGVRRARGLLDEWSADVRSHDIDIDPSFPEKPPTWECQLHPLFDAGPTTPLDWLAKGPRPDYDHLLCVEAIDDNRGPWLLLEGYIEESSPDKDRGVFTFLRGILGVRQDIDQLVRTFNETEYPGNRAIPEPGDDYYTFAGEIPWSARYGSTLRDQEGRPQRDVRDAFSRHTGEKWTGIPIEVPVHGFAWESYHSHLNDVSGIHLPSPAICQQLGLRRLNDWDLVDRDGRKASLFRSSGDQPGRRSAHAAYLRADLLDQYLAVTGQELAWLIWGERMAPRLAHSHSSPELQAIYASHALIHKHVVLRRARTLVAPPKVGSAKPAKSKPAKSKPAKSKPAKSKPAKSKPAKSKPAKSKPAKSKAVNSGRHESPQAGRRAHH